MELDFITRLESAFLIPKKTNVFIYKMNKLMSFITMCRVKYKANIHR
jgi:hypothetical protein